MYPTPYTVTIKFYLFIIAFSFGLITCPALWAKNIVVQSSDKPGSAPISKAVKQASAGDVIILEPGIYREHVIINKSLTLRGLPGAIMNGAKRSTLAWRQADDLPGVYVASAKKRIKGLLVDGKFIAEIRSTRTTKAGDWHWKKLLSKGPPRSAFKEILGLWMYDPESQQIYARFPNAQDPKNLQLSFFTTSSPMIYIDGAKEVIIENLTFEQCSSAIRIERQAQRCVVRQCRITSFESTGIMLSGNASHCLIEACDITRGSLEEWSPSLQRDKANYEIWQIHKIAGNYDRNAIVLFRAGPSNKIINNHLHRVFDGISLGDYQVESLDIPLQDPDHGRDTEIANNLIEHTRDSGIELGAACINVEVHHNLLRQTHGGLRFKLPRIGPIYIHHNRLIDGAPFNIWFSMDASPAEAYVYHNTVVGGREFLLPTGFTNKRDFLAPRWHFLNNLSLKNSGFCKAAKTRSLDFTATGNVSSGSTSPWPLDDAKNKNNLYSVAIAHDSIGKPLGGSAAIDKGIDLSTYLKGKSLPGCESGYFKGKAPDAGADEIE